MLESGGRVKGAVLRAANVLVLLSMNIRERNEDQEHAFLQHVEVTHPINMADETLGRVQLRCSTDDEVDSSLRRDTVIIEEEDAHL